MIFWSISFQVMYLSRILVRGDEFPRLKITDLGVGLRFIDVRYSPAGESYMIGKFDYS